MNSAVKQFLKLKATIQLYSLYIIIYIYIYIFLSDSECEAAVVLYWPGFNGHEGFELQLLC